MSTLSFSEKRQLEKLFGMPSGYVLDFTDRTFGEFFVDYGAVDIHTPTYSAGGTSKANKLRTFWQIESDPFVGKILLALIEHFESIADDPDEMVKAAQCRAIAQRLLSADHQLSALKGMAQVFNAAYLSEQIRRMEQATTTDPALAIGTAKELIETCCKTILSERGKSMSGAPPISELTKAVFKELKLVPEGVPEQARGAKTIRVLLSNLATITQSLAELRGLYGTGHGKHGKFQGLTARHAKLAVGAATTLTNFLFETHKEVS